VSERYYSSGKGGPSEDPLKLFGAILTKASTVWKRWTYPFAGFGKNVSIHHKCDISRTVSNRIQIGNDVYIANSSWLACPERAVGEPPSIILRNGCKIGRRCTLSGKNHVELQEDVLLGPSVLIMDHNHEYSDTERPIYEQGVTPGGRIIIERNCWLGYGATILCNQGELRIGRNSIVGAGAVVTRSFPPVSIIVGNPAILLKTFDQQTKQWVKPRA
jgi:acetyltransferase-like isoleucine patch superfamily enzyme